MTRRKPIMPKNWHCWTSQRIVEQQSEQAATNYFGCYEQATKAYFPNICEEEKIQLPTYKTKRNRLLSPSWKHRKSRFPLARHWWTASSQAAIRQTPPSCRRCGTSANWPYWKGCWKHLRWTSIKRISRNIRTASLSLKSTLRRTNGFIRS